MKMDVHSSVRGGWLPSDRAVARAFLKDLRSKAKKVERETEKRLLAVSGEPYDHESIRKYKQLIDEDPIIQMYFTKMIDQVPGYYKDNEDSGGFYLESIDEMLRLLDHILGIAPEYNETDLVGFPINLVLGWTMGVPAGFAVYRLEQLNRAFREILDEWCEFLQSPASCYVLNPEPGGWMCEAAIEQLEMDQYDYDPDAEHWGFESWNAFFIRGLAKNPDGTFKYRPITAPEDDSVIVSACDSNIYAIQHQVKEMDWFWVKAQPYSLHHMLASDVDDDSLVHNDQFVKPFVGGDVYQAFLSATEYHRWHSPVSGTIKKAYVKQGTYYSSAESEGMDPAGPDDSQGYITHVATRAIIFIEADNPAIGLVGFMAVGMAEVSSCVITVEEGQAVGKGQELGYFQYGGSSHCLIFRPGVIEEFTVGVGMNPRMGEKIAMAKAS